MRIEWQRKNQPARCGLLHMFYKSYFTKTDGLNVQFNATGFRLEATIDTAISTSKDNGQWLNEGAAVSKTNKVVSIFKGAGKKEFLLNDVPYLKYSEHIGKFPCVMIAPDDIELIMGGSEERRRFIDTVISQVDAEYLQQLIVYTKVLQQRNSLLKKFAEQGAVNWTLLEVLDEQLIPPGDYLYKKRKEFTLQLIPLVQQFYNQIASNEELVTLQYESQLNNNNFAEILNQLRQKDFILQRSNGGIHKDDLSFQLNGQIFKSPPRRDKEKVYYLP